MDLGNKMSGSVGTPESTPTATETSYVVSQEKSSKDLFFEVRNSALALDKQLGGQLLSEVSDAPRGTLYVFPFVEEGSNGLGFGFFADEGPVFMDGVVARKIDNGTNWVGASKATDKGGLRGVGEDELERWNNAVRESVTIADERVKKEAEKIRIAMKTLDLFRNLANLAKGKDLTPAPTSTETSTHTSTHTATATVTETESPTSTPTGTNTPEASESTNQFGVAHADSGDAARMDRESADQAALDAKDTLGHSQ